MSRQIKVADSTHEKLEMVKKVNKMTFDGAIQFMLQGCVDDMYVIKREQTAVTLHYEGYGNIDEYSRSCDIMDEAEYQITFNQLKVAEVGDIFEAPLRNYTYYSYEIATVVYADEELVVLKIKSITELPWVYPKIDIDLIGVALF